MTAEQQTFERWCWSDDGEGFRGDFATEVEAHDAAIAWIDQDAKGADKPTEHPYWVGRTCHPLDLVERGEKRFLFSGEAFFEQVEEWCGEEVAAEGDILDLTRDDLAELGRLVHAFIRSRAKVQIYGVRYIVRHVHTAGVDHGW